MKGGKQPGAGRPAKDKTNTYVSSVRIKKDRAALILSAYGSLSEFFNKAPVIPIEKFGN